MAHDIRASDVAPIYVHALHLPVILVDDRLHRIQDGLGHVVSVASRKLAELTDVNLNVASHQGLAVRPSGSGSGGHPHDPVFQEPPVSGLSGDRRPPDLELEIGPQERCGYRSNNPSPPRHFIDIIPTGRAALTVQGLSDNHLPDCLLSLLLDVSTSLGVPRLASTPTSAIGKTFRTWPFLPAQSSGSLGRSS